MLVTFHDNTKNDSTKYVIAGEPMRGSTLFFIIARRQNLSDVRLKDMCSRLCFLYQGIPGCL